MKLSKKLGKSLKRLERDKEEKMNQSRLKERPTRKSKRLWTNYARKLVFVTINKGENLEP